MGRFRLSIPSSLQSHPEHLTRLTKAMGFDPNRCKMTAEEKTEGSRARAEGKPKRQRVLDYLTECLTSLDSPLDAEQLRELTATGFYFPDLKAPTDKVCEVFQDKPDLKRTILLAAAVDILNRLIA